MNKYPKLSDLKAAGIPTGREAHLRAVAAKKAASEASRLGRQDARSEFVDIFKKGFK
jgi:hypothetical protein